MLFGRRVLREKAGNSSTPHLRASIAPLMPKIIKRPTFKGLQAVRG
jgi:hypothetical protein